MAIVLGFNAKAYYGAGGVTATTELTNIRNVTQNVKKGEADVTTRGGGGWRQKVGTLKEGDVSFEMLHNTSDAGYQFIRDAYFNDTTIAMAFFDEAGGSGLDADFSVMDFSRVEDLEDALKYNVTVSITDSTRTPTWT